MNIIPWQQFLENPQHYSVFVLSHAAPASGDSHTQTIVDSVFGSWFVSTPRQQVVIPTIQRASHPSRRLRIDDSPHGAA